MNDSKITQLSQIEIESNNLQQEIQRLEALARFHLKCRYSKCGKEFITDDERKRYCCNEHYLAANRERTLEKNKLRRHINGTNMG